VPDWLPPIRIFNYQTGPKIAQVFKTQGNESLKFFILLLSPLRRLLVLVLLGGLSLQLYFFLRVALCLLVDPSSTSFERSEAFRITQIPAESSYFLPQIKLPWLQDWRPYTLISSNIKRAVIVSEDDTFSTHVGVQWEALERAWANNNKAQAYVEHYNKGPHKQIKIVGGSTITQQLAKNLFLSKERTLLRKAQELIITFELETILSKSRILEIYLNHVEWGRGVFGVEGAARHYFSRSSLQLSASEAAKLAVMLPRPKYFERNLGSLYLSERAQVIVSRMNSAKLP
jgi:monofunctional biosynthetic peptidoglycan transglycosylase